MIGLTESYVSLSWMKNNMIARNPVLVVGIAITLIATAASGVLFRRPVNGGDNRPPSPPVLYAQRAIEAGVVLRKEHLRGVSGSMDSREEHLSSQLIDKVTRHDIQAGQPIRVGDVSDPQTWSSVRIPHGYRALRIALTPVQSGQLDLIKNGDHVDVIGLPDQPGAGRARLIAQDLRVLVVNPVSSVKSETSKEGTSDTQRALVLAVTDEQAVRISEAEASGPLRFLLRNPDDHSAFVEPEREPSSGTLAPATSSKPAPREPQVRPDGVTGPVLAPLPPAPNRVRIIRGITVEEVETPR